MLASTSGARFAAARLALALPGQVHVGLTRTEPIPRLASGIASLDTLLDGGVPRGRVSELCGPLSCGKTSLALSLVAAVTRRDGIVACIDLPDALQPASVAAAGADLRRVLWVRPASMVDAMRCTELLLQAGGFALIVLDVCTPVPRRVRGFVWPRLMRAAEQSHTAVLVLTPHRIAGSFAALSLAFCRRTARWHHGAWPLFDGFDIAARIERTKLGAPQAKSVPLRVESQQR